MAAHATSKGRNKKQKLKEQYSKLREDAQLHGVIPTTPEGAVRDERVDPATQGEADTFDVVCQAATRGWASSEQVKRQAVNKIAEILYEGPQTVVTKDGREVVVPPDRNVMIKAVNVLLTADQRQYERDNPAEAGKAKGGGQGTVVNVNLFEVVAAAAQHDRPDEVEQKIRSIEVGDGPPKSD